MNFVPNNFKVATLQLDLDCVTADVKLGTRMMPPSFLDFTDSESDIQTPASCYDFLFPLLLRSSTDSLLYYLDFSPSFRGCLMPKPGFLNSVPRMASLLCLLMDVSFTSCTTCCTACFLLSHRPLTLYIRLGFSAMDTAWSVRRVSTYIKTAPPVLISLT